MEKIEYKKFQLSDLSKNTDDFFIYSNGLRIILKKEKNKFVFNLNDEVLNEPFSEKTIKLISERFSIKNAKIESNWARKDPPFYDNNLTFESEAEKNFVFNLVNFIFETIYKIND